LVVVLLRVAIMEWLSSWGFIRLRVGEAVQLSVGTVGADAKLINGSRE
jgi:hypothetical protein